MYFTGLSAQPNDPILAMMSAFAHDDRASKIDLGVGVYRDEAGRTPIMRAVKRAEDRLLGAQATKSYLGVEGDAAFVAAVQALLFGEAPLSRSIGGVQAVGGTGALRLAADLMALEKPDRTVWLGLPSWPNHVSLFKAAGLSVQTYAHIDPLTQSLNLPAIEAAIAAAREGDVFIIHGCCHNPTGVDLDLAAWRHIGAQLTARNMLPLVDIAYHGFGAGLAEDSAGMLALLDVVPAALVAYSCSKNFALYRERVGALFVLGAEAGVDLALSNLMPIARANYSMPPDHGAAVVRTILASEELRRDWEAELATMRARVRTLRCALAAHGRVGAIDLTALGDQNGFFSMLPITAEQSMALRDRQGIYIVPNGRMNIAGLREEQVERLVAGLAGLS